MSELTGTAAIRNGGPLLGGSESPWAAGCCEMPETGPLWDEVILFFVSVSVTTTAWLSAFVESLVAISGPIMVSSMHASLELESAN